MSRRAFRIYKIFAGLLCLCALALGGFLGWKSRVQAYQPAPEKYPVLSIPTTVPETTTAPVETMSPEEQIYLRYFQACPYNGGTYTLQDMDGNGVPEMLIWPDEDVHEIVTIADGEPVVLFSDYGLFLCEGNIVGQYGEGSGGCTVWYYQIHGTQVQPLVCIVWMFHEDAWYTSTDYTGNWDTMTPISKEEKNEIVSKYLPLDKDIPDSGYRYFLYREVLQLPPKEQ